MKYSRFNRKLRIWLTIILVGALAPSLTDCSILDYIWPDPNKDKSNTALDAFPAIPYELSEGDETFMREASKWIGTNLSKLDLCHHRVIMKLKKSCHELNAEQLGKLAVMLLNCQSDSEGRRVYYCTEQMTLKECTGDMDPDTWNAYHLVTNRAKAVCASVRHDQFRGLTELTVNKLMNTAHEQIAMMGQLAENQKELQSVTQEAIDEMANNNNKIIDQQGDIMRLSEAHRAKVESNFRDLVREKSLIRAGQQEVAVLLTDLRDRIDESIKQLETQTKKNKLNHASLLSDMESLQSGAAVIAAKIDETSAHITVQHQTAEKQFEYTLDQLQKINDTITNMLTIIDAFQKNFDEKLSWITEKIGGSDSNLKKINTIVTHFCYIVFGMICLSFVGADKFVRVFFIILVPGNLLGNLVDLFESDVIQLSVILISFILADLICRLALRFYPAELQRVNITPTNNDQTDSQRQQREPSVAPSINPVDSDENDDDNSEYEFRRETPSYARPSLSRFSRERSVTPLMNGTTGRSVTPSDSVFNGDRQPQCHARTLRGDQCRGMARSGSDFCRLHTPRGL
ncbi:protein brambleberry-like [Sabethes cyaneus]|uniref:protein brambleberry-like n=1 Tax=Sabethes cyaneus TaxID=53552 RepID=UPI00237E1B5E|nr:protein brambleberry-like [Sabethes cyaneus]XP_053695289.1 protein brambleberry-like [Sabethes cyaneus]